MGREVEQWLSTQQAQVLRAAKVPRPIAGALPKFCLSFDGTGVPMRQAELVGRAGKQANGSARTREAKLGCVFTQTGLDKKGRPQRDPDTTTYVGAIESSTLLGWRLYAEAVRRGLDEAQEVIALTDGARYNRTIVQTHFPGALPIVDLFHSYEHLHAIAPIFWGPEAEAPKAWRDLLEAGDIQRLLRKTGKQLPASAKSKKLLRKELGYFEGNAAHMRYAHFQGQEILCRLGRHRGRLPYGRGRAAQTIWHALVGARS